MRIYTAYDFTLTLVGECAKMRISKFYWKVEVDLKKPKKIRILIDPNTQGFKIAFP